MLVLGNQKWQAVQMSVVLTCSDPINKTRSNISTTMKSINLCE